MKSFKLKKAYGTAPALSFVMLVPIWILVFFLIFSLTISYNRWLTLEEYTQGIIRSASTTLPKDRRCAYISRIAGDEAVALGIQNKILWTIGEQNDPDQRASSDAENNVPIIRLDVKTGIGRVFGGNEVIVKTTYAMHPDSFKSRGRWNNDSTMATVCYLQ